MRSLCVAIACFVTACGAPSSPFQGSVAELTDAHHIEVSAWIGEISPGALALRYRVSNPTARNLCLLPNMPSTKARAVAPHVVGTSWAQTDRGLDILGRGPIIENWSGDPRIVLDAVASGTDKVFSIPFPADVQGPLSPRKIAWGLNIVMYPCDGFELRPDGRYWGVLDSVTGADAAMFEGGSNGRSGPVILVGTGLYAQSPP